MNSENELRVQIAMINNPKPETPAGLRHLLLNRALELLGKQAPPLPPEALAPLTHKGA